MFDGLRGQFDSDVTIVESPDHPVLISPPDSLVAKNGKILACYKPHHAELSRPKNLLSRLALSRYALPTHTLHVLVISETACIDKLSGLFSFFDEVIELRDLLSSIRLLDRKVSELTIERANTGREMHYVKYNLLYELSLKQLRAEAQEEREIDINLEQLKTVYYSDWLNRLELSSVNKRSFESKLFYQLSRSYLTIPDFSKSKRRFELLRNICLSSLQIDSKYDDGIYLGSKVDSKLILSDTLPGYRHDSLKGLRSVSFAGLGLTHAKNDESLERYTDYQNYKIEMGWHEYNKKKNRHYKRNRNW
ncbi:TPA: hypothetical protein I7709_20510 [Vibrio vulnificus]|nr:hypothetical protein [Vibrio vulnificus]